MEIAVISGKGGTGKSSITAAITNALGNVVLADCDVDTANLHLLFNPEIGAGTLVLLTSFAFAVIGAFYIMMGLKLKNAHEWRKV